jgi:hypothetical protein
MDWAQVISKIENRHKSLSRLCVKSKDGLLLSKIPSILTFSVGIASAIFEDNSKYRKLVLVFPRSFDSAFWIAVGFVLTMMEEDFLPSIEQLPPFLRGQRLLLDNRFVVEYDCEEIIGNQRFIWLRQGGPSTRLTMPLRERLRLQPVTTQKPLTKPRSIQPPSLHPLDHLLQIQSYGNRSIFRNRAILVSVLKQAREFASNTFVGASKGNQQESAEIVSLTDLFQWGAIDREGVSEPWHQHQVDAEPVLYVAFDLSSVRENLRSCSHSSPLIILDGGGSFGHDLDALDEIVDTGHPVIAIMEQAEKEDVKLLYDRSFKVWVWSEKNVQEIHRVKEQENITAQNSPFFHFQRALHNYGEQKISAVQCTTPLIQEVASKLETLGPELNSGLEDTRIIEMELYGCLLSLSRLLRPIGHSGATGWSKKIEKRIERIESEVIRNAIWLSKTSVTIINELITDLKRILSLNSVGENGKPEVLRELISGSSTKTTAVIVSDTDEVKFTEDYYRNHPGGFSSVHFCCPLTVKTNINYSRLIVCGWLGMQKMRRLLDNCFAPEVIVMTFPFEQVWLRSAMRRWKSSRVSVLKQSEKAKLLKFDTAEVPPDEKEEEGLKELEDKKVFDIGEFEHRLRVYRRKAFAEIAAGGEETVQGRLVELSDNRFAFLTETHRIPVVTDFYTGRADESEEIPLKIVSELRIGDRVIFREGSQSDLIREIADQGLSKAGRVHLREVAGLWKHALRRFIKVAIPVILEKIDAKYKDIGLKDSLWIIAALLKEKGCNRHPQTIRNWLTDEHLIGPRSDRDLDLVLHVTGDNELKSRLEEVRRAIKEVRGAHKEASHYLVRKLLASLPQHLEHAGTESIKIEVEGFGRAIVIQVNDIAEEPINVASSKVNRLLREEF